MATEKTIQTRIQLKYDTWDAWEAVKDTFKPKKGEVCIVEVPSGDTAVNGEDARPQYLMKVGAEKNSTTHELYTFAELDWVSAKAADVYAWAKEANMPIATASKVGGVKVGYTANGKNYPVKVDADGDAYVNVPWSAPTSFNIAANATDDDVITLTGTGGSNGVTYDAKHAKKGPASGYTSGNTTTTISGSGGKGTIKIPQITVDAYGHVTTAADESVTITMPTIPSIPSINVTDSAAGASATTDEVDVVTDVTASGHTLTLARAKVASKKYVDDAISGVTEFDVQVVTTLPETGVKGVIYLKADNHGTGDVYDEYIWVTDKYEKIGNTDVNLSGYVPTSRKVNNKALTADITLNASDVGVTETAFPGLKKTGTVTGVKMNGGNAITPTNGVVDLGTVITDISGKQDKLNTNQLAAVNSGITSTKVGTYDGYATSKQNTIDASHKLAASLVSGLATVATSGSYNDLADKPTINNNNQTIKVGSTTFGANDVVGLVNGTNITIAADASKKTITINGKSDAAIKTLAEAQIDTHSGVDKVGTVTSVSTGTGLKVTQTASVNPKVEIDDAVVFVLNCGSSTVNV